MPSLPSRWWPRRTLERDLSSYADGELAPAATERVAARLALDAEARSRLRRLRAVDRVVDASLAPDHKPDTEAAVAAVMTAVAAPPAAAAATRSRWNPVAVASVGLLLTAGLAFAGYRWRARLQESPA